MISTSHQAERFESRPRGLPARARAAVGAAVADVFAADAWEARGDDDLRYRRSIQNAFVLDSLRIMFLGASLLLIVVTAFISLFMTGLALVFALILGALLSCSFFAIYRCIARGRIAGRYAHPLAAALCALGYAFHLFQVIFDGSAVTPLQLVGLTVVTIAPSVAYLSFRWLVSTVTIVLAVWSLVLLTVEAHTNWIETIYLYLVLIVFAFFYFYGRRRAVSAIIDADTENRKQNEQLAAALERAHLSEAQLRAERDFADQIVESMGQGLMLLDSEGRIEFVNPAAEQIVEVPEARLVGRKASDVLVPVEATAARLGAGIERSQEALVRSKDTGQRNVLVSSTPRPDGGSIITLTDLTLRKQFESKLERLAHYDALTGLPNRPLFMDRMRQALGRLERHNARLAVMFLDLDRFKWVNDTLGHAVGDQVLVETARRIERCTRSHDTAARFGGDEFVVLLTDLADAEEALQIADRIAAQVQAPHALDGREHLLEVSIGIVICQTFDADPEMLIRQADVAMYQAKRRRDLNRVLFTPDMASEMAAGLHAASSWSVATGRR